MFSEIDIAKLKSKLKDYSKDYKENFNKIEKYIKSEIEEISKLKASKKSIIPEISFNQINQRNNKIVESIKKRGCVIIRDVFENLTIERLNNDLEKFNSEFMNILKILYYQYLIYIQKVRIIIIII